MGHFDGIVPSLACILTNQHGISSGKYSLKTSGNTNSETLIFKMSLDASALKNLCLVRVRTPPIFHYQSSTENLFHSPAFQRPFSLTQTQQGKHYIA